MSNASDNELNFDDLDFNKNKRGKRKNQPDNKRWTIFLIQGLIGLVALVTAGQFFFTDNAEVSDLQATIAAQNNRPVLSAQGLYERALEEIAVGNSSLALRDLDLAIELEPAYTDAYYQRALLHYDLNNYRQALTDFTSALDLGYEEDEDLFYSMAVSHFELEEYSKAAEDYDRVLELNDENINALYWRGRSYAKAGLYTTAVKDIEMAIEMGYEELEYAYFYLALAYDDLGDYEKAAALYTRSIEKIEAECETYHCWIDYNNRGVEYYQLGDYQGAIKDYTKAIQLNPEPYALALQNRGDAYHALSEHSSALADWNTMFTMLEKRVITREFLADSNILTAGIDGAGVQVHVSFVGKKGETVNIISAARNPNLDTMLIVRNPEANAIAYNDQYDDMNDAQILKLVLPEDGTYTIVVADSAGDNTGDFTLKLER